MKLTLEELAAFLRKKAAESGSFLSEEQSLDEARVLFQGFALFGIGEDAP